MYLSDKDLKYLALHHNLITPFVTENCAGATIDLTLDAQVKRPINSGDAIMLTAIPEDHYQTFDITSTPFYLEPGESILVQSFEYFKIPTDKIANIFERYSIKLLGLVVSPASYMNPGYEGRLSFLMTNHSIKRIQLIAGVKFCQLAISQLTSISETPYSKQNAKYLGGNDVHTSKLHLDKEIQNYLSENGLGNVTDLKAKEIGKHFISQLEDNKKKYLDIINGHLGATDE